MGQDRVEQGGSNRTAMGQPPQGRRGGTPPIGREGDPIAAIAAELGVDAGALREAVGPPPPDLRRAAREFGIRVQTLREAFMRHRPR